MWLNCYENNKTTFFLYLSSNWFSDNKHKLIFIVYHITPIPYIKKAANYPLCPNGVNNFYRIILYHKCVCGILSRKLKKYSKYTMKTCQENSWHICMMCYLNLVIGWCMQGWLKGQSPILNTAIMVPRKRLSRAIAATFWPRGRRALRARRPRGPNVKKMEK